MHPPEYNPLSYEEDGPTLRAELADMYGENGTSKFRVKAHALAEIRMHTVNRASDVPFSQSELALAAGVGQAYVSRLENGKTSETDPAKLLAIASVLGVPLDQIAVTPSPKKPVDATESEAAAAADIAPGETPDGLTDDVAQRIAKSLAEPVLATSVDGQPFGNVYFPVGLIDPKGNRITPESVIDFDQDAINLVIGPIGSGKTMLLRELASAALAEGDWIPIFLDRFSMGKDTIADTIIRRAATFDIKVLEETIGQLLGRDGLILIIDGLDELAESSRVACLAELATLKRQLPLLTVIVTARPGTELERSENVRVWRSAPLSDDEVAEFARRITSGCDEETIRRLRLAKLDDTDRLLLTPLFASQILPLAAQLQSPRQTFVAFLKDIFDLSVRRQNLAASGTRRELSSGSTFEQLQTFFEKLCFQVFNRYGDQSLHVSDLRRQAALAASSTGISANAETMLEDIVHVSNFITEERGHCSFSNRAIQHFHAAAHLCELEIGRFADIAEDIRIHWQRWEPVITYLQLLAPERVATAIELVDLELLFANGPTSFLSHFQSFIVTRLENGGGQLHVSMATLLTIQHQRMQFGNVQNWKVIDTIGDWYSGTTLADLPIGQPTRLTPQNIDFAALEKALGKQLEPSMRQRLIRLTELRGRGG